MNNELFTGVIGDPREDERVKNGWSSEEILPSAAVIEWKPKTLDELKKYTIWHQNGSGSCVAFAKAKQIAIEIQRQTGVWFDMSPASIYQLRANQGTAGMNIADANEIVNKRGVAFEAFMKSQNLTEAQINAVKRTALADKLALAIADAVINYLYVPVNIDKIAQAIEEYEAVSLLIFANGDEYGDIPQINNPNLTYAAATIKHEITAIDYYLHPTYGKSLWIEDSWGLNFGQGGRRTITEAFLLKRCILADHFVQLQFNGQQEESGKPVYTFNNNLNFSPTFFVNEEVKILQNILKYEGLFPVDKESTGYYGAITARAVLAFQNKHGVPHDNLEGKLVGIKTRSKLNALYS